MDALGPALPLGSSRYWSGGSWPPSTPSAGRRGRWRTGWRRPRWRRAVSPLAELAGRLDRPDEVVFTARADGPSPAGLGRARRLRRHRVHQQRPLPPAGAQLPLDPDLTVPGADGRRGRRRRWRVRRPWLPGRARCGLVEGLDRLVDPDGSLLLPTARRTPRTGSAGTPRSRDRATRRRRGGPEAAGYRGHRRAARGSPGRGDRGVARRAAFVTTGPACSSAGSATSTGSPG